MCLSHCVLYLHQGFIENIRLINCQLKKVGVPQEQSEDCISNKTENSFRTMHEFKPQIQDIWIQILGVFS